MQSTSPIYYSISSSWMAESIYKDFEDISIRKKGFGHDCAKEDMNESKRLKEQSEEQLEALMMTNQEVNNNDVPELKMDKQIMESYSHKFDDMIHWGISPEEAGLERILSFRLDLDI